MGFRQIYSKLVESRSKWGGGNWQTFLQTCLKNTWILWYTHGLNEAAVRWRTCGNNYCLLLLIYQCCTLMLHWCICWWKAIMSKAKVLGVRIRFVFDMTHPDCPTFPHQISNLFSHYSVIQTIQPVIEFVGGSVCKFASWSNQIWSQLVSQPDSQSSAVQLCR